MKMTDMSSRELKLIRIIRLNGVYNVGSEYLWENVYP